MRSLGRFALAAVVVTLLLAAVVSGLASARPDGLQRVAQEQGFADEERESATAGSPFADYGTEGLGDGPLSGAVSGLAGVAVTFAVVGGVLTLARRRDPDR